MHRLDVADYTAARHHAIFFFFFIYDELLHRQ
jgi:hypothetical protein